MITVSKFAMFFTSVLLTSAALATPAQVVIIRHGEKPETGGHVNEQGCIRAFALTSFFDSNETVNAFGIPVAVFAMHPSEKNDGDPDADPSLRPIETISPTADELGLEIQIPATRLQYQKVVAAVMGNPAYDGKTVLIAWEHKAIPGLAEALGATLTAQDSNWDGSVFDEAWVLRYGRSSELSSFPKATLSIIPEEALPTDRTTGGLDGWTTPALSDSTCDTAGNCLAEHGFANFDPSHGECNDDTVLDTIMKKVLATPADFELQ